MSLLVEFSQAVDELAMHAVQGLARSMGLGPEDVSEESYLLNEFEVQVEFFSSMSCEELEHLYSERIHTGYEGVTVFSYDEFEDPTQDDGDPFDSYYSQGDLPFVDETVRDNTRLVSVRKPVPICPLADVKSR